MSDTEPLREADSGDVAEQSRLADDSIDEADFDTTEVGLECDPADILTLDGPQRSRPRVPHTGLRQPQADPDIS